VATLADVTTYDVARVRAHFPSLQAFDAAAHFDAPGGTQTPDVVGQAVYDVLTGPLSNRGTVTVAERNAEAVVGECRQALADLLGGDPRGVVFGRSMTQLTMDLARTMAQGWGPGDEIVVTRLDHDADVRPWVIAAERAGATVRFADFDVETGELPVAAVEAVLSERTRLVAVTAASNLIGTQPDLAAISAAVHGVGGLLFVDGVHHTAHALVDVAALGADVYACSPYKFLGPHCGVLHARPELWEGLHPDKLAPSTDAVPERFELGTLPYELMAGTTAAVDFLADLAQAPGTRRERLAASWEQVHAHEEQLRARIEEHLAGLPGVTLWSRAARRTPTLLATFEGVDPQQLREHLARAGVNAPAGSFYAYETVRHLGLGDVGGLRLGLAPYSDDADVDRLLACLDSFAWPA
jgi:cysteine desulfurase family protein (TIGR01976 family)